jgi:hypothetical protein
MSDNDKALVPVEQREVEFYEDRVLAVRVEDGTVYVPIRPICDLLGVAWAGQYERLKRNEVLSDLLMSVSVTLTDIAPSDRRPRTSEMICLPLDYIAGFLFGINAGRVKPELKERVLRYQRECYKVLAEAFQEGRLTSEPSFSELLNSADPDVVQAYQIAQAVVNLARNQIMIEARLSGRIEAQQTQLEDHDQRLELIEATLGDEDRYVTEKQATAINQAVRSIGLVLSQKSGRNEYGACWGEFYRKFGVSKYRHLPAAKFDDAMKWLAEWYSSLTDEEVPF